MLFQLTPQLFVLLVIAVMYAIFDVFNKRNVPDVFAYASIIIGIIATLVYSAGTMLLSFGMAIVIGIVGYAIYRGGLWGAGDYFELAAISLLLPLQPQPILSSIPQLGFPFILSVFIATGFTAIWLVPIYYLLFKKKKGPVIRPDYRHVVYAVALMALYMLLIFFVELSYGFWTSRSLLVLLVAIPSAVTLAFEEEVTSRMVENVYPSQLEEGDIIAFNMMSESERRYFISRYRGFGRLATKEAIQKIRRISKRIPVYKNAAPLAFFVLIGVAISLLFGNIILFVL